MPPHDRPDRLEMRLLVVAELLEKAVQELRRVTDEVRAGGDSDEKEAGGGSDG